jgi:hypothetical protein
MQEGSLVLYRLGYGVLTHSRIQTTANTKGTFLDEEHENNSMQLESVDCGR